MANEIATYLDSIPGLKKDWKKDWKEDAKANWKFDWDKTAGNLSPPVNIAVPVISGTPEVGSVLTVANGTWSFEPTFTYAWKADGVTFSTAGNSVTLAIGQLGKMITCEVKGTNAQGNETIPAVAVGPVAAFV